MTASEIDLRAALPAQRTTATTGIEIDPPLPGHAVMACACGAVLDARGMRRKRRHLPGGPPIAPICCEACSW